MPRRYSYTPRRDQRQVRRQSRSSGSASPIVPVLVALAILLGVGWFSTRGNDGGALEPGGEEVLAAATPRASLAAAVSPPAAPRGTPNRTAVGGLPSPRLTAYAAVVIEEPCGKVVWGLNPYLRLPPASLTKIVTALVAADNSGLDRLIDIGIDGGALSLETDSTVMGLRPGMSLTLRDLIAGLMLRSGADAAVTIAQAIAGTPQDFARLMNEKVASLGLEDSHFVNPHGLEDPDQRVTAYDMAVLGGELLTHPDLAEIVRTQVYQPNWSDGPIQNINLLLSQYPGAIGVKTGFTDEAGMTIVGAAERDGRRLVVSVLHSEDLYVDAAKVLDWGFSTEPACDTPAVAVP